MTNEQAIKILSNRDGHGIPSGYNGGYAEAIEVAIETLKAEPIKHGHWIYEQLPLPLSDGSKECVRCSVCNTHWDNESNYCPNCGAKMDLTE